MQCAKFKGQSAKSNVGLLADVAALTALLPSLAGAHTTALFVSTPFSPPDEWTWMIPVYLALQTVMATFVLKDSSKRLLRIVWHLCVVAGASFIVLIYGIASASSSTAPPPGLAIGHRPFYGYGWDYAGGAFVWFNLVGLGVLLLATWWLETRGVLKEEGRGRKLLAGTSIVYFACVIPFATFGPMGGGWHGGYVVNRCRQRVTLAARSVYYSTLNNGQTLPRKPLDEIVAAFKDDVTTQSLKDQFTRIRLPLICPQEYSYSRTPRHYEWNYELAGRDVEFLRSVPGDTVLISCPNNHGFLESCPTLTVEGFLQEWDLGMIDPDWKLFEYTVR